MGKVIAIANHKGGVGKTATAVNLSACLANLDKKVLVIDCDSQGHCGISLGIEIHSLEKSLYDVLIAKRGNIANIILTTNVNNLHIAASNIKLAGAEVELSSRLGREQALKKSLKSIRDSYDYILIDCPPNLGLLTINALVCSDSVIIPCSMAYYSLEGINQLLDVLDMLNEDLDLTIKVEGALMTMYDARTKASKKIESELKNFFGKKMFNIFIRVCSDINEATDTGQTVCDFKYNSKGCIDYTKLAKEVVNKNE